MYVVMYTLMSGGPIVRLKLDTLIGCMYVCKVQMRQSTCYL